MAHIQRFQAHILTFLCANRPSLSVREKKKKREKGILIWCEIAANKDTLSPLCWRHKVHSCQKYLTSISARLLHGKKKKKTEKERKVDIDQMRVQTNSAGVRLGIQWRTMSPRQPWHPPIHPLVDISHLPSFCWCDKMILHEILNSMPYDLWV